MQEEARAAGITVEALLKQRSINQTQNEEADEKEEVEGNWAMKHENMVFQCKYVVPYASEVIVDERDPNSKKMYIQVSNQNEKARVKARDSLNEKNNFEIFLYNITDDKVRLGKSDMPAPESRIKVPMNR